MNADLLSGALAVIPVRVTAAPVTAAPRLRLHTAVRGTRRLVLDGQQPLRLEEGDMAVSNGSAAARDDVAIRIGGSCEKPVLTAIPALTLIRGGSPAATTLRFLLDGALRELDRQRPGSAFATRTYARLILTEVLRVAMNADARRVPESGLRLLADNELRPALALIHTRPADPWRLTDLAEAVSMSRSTFARRFRVVSGEPPLTYLYRWRIQLARVALRETGTPIVALAAELGYASESSFSHTFTRASGMSPSQYRTLSRRP
ncbi:AraC family transcriptional regulator [Actinoplanes sp. TBRC 11911]|uniref:helix-turn-helix transcriptional regulator n=1 Tax=Actinoplanes sp. TBRC 11911 TaxID=2729386 RepID=UPI00145F754D|nr:AraC family transcriptional regulator [Actinoplanes sp. TBRC 11911]NMO49856.1 AraC family transcriptional regulator [Actinoplanes sp. TBRC 11911]